MNQLPLPSMTQNLFDFIIDLATLNQAFKEVRKNNGSPGIDNVSVLMFKDNLAEELDQLRKELLSWDYKPAPVKQVLIPKPGKPGQFRTLGIPCVRDRVVQTAIKLR